MESDIDIVEWAKTLGFEGAYDLKFQEACPKLVPPTMRNVWRHLISHVLPVEKASSIRKHCLLYKLQLEESIHKDINLQARVKNLKEYERYVKINSLKIILSNLQGKIESYCNEIKALRSRLNPTNEKYKIEKEKEKEKLIKCKLIELKIKSTKNEIKELKQMQSIMDYYINARSEIPYSESSTEWESEVIEYCNDLPKGQEINKLSKQLGSLLLTTLNFKTDDNLTIEKKNQLLQEMHLIHIRKFSKVEEHRKNYESLKKKNNLLKQKCIQKFNEQYGKLLHEELERMMSSNIEDIVEQSEAALLTNLENSWTLKKKSGHTDQYVKLQNEIANFNEQIERKTNAINESMSGQDKLIKNCMKIQKAIKEEPKEALAKIKASHKQLAQEIVSLNFLPSEIDLLLKTSFSKRNNISDPNSQNPPAVSLLKIGKYDLIIDELKIELPNIDIDAEMEIYSFKNEHTVEEQLNNRYKKLREIVQNIQKLKSSSLSLIEFWKEQPLSEGSRSSPEDYMIWRNRCKEAMRTLKMELHEFDSSENDFSFSSSTGSHSFNEGD